MRTLSAILALAIYKTIAHYSSTISADDGIMFMLAYLFIGEFVKEKK